MSERRFSAITASAGSGKTFRLANRFVALLAEGEDPGSILAATFTRKAAGEILERVIAVLAEAASGDGPGALARLREHAHAGLTPERCRAVLARLLDDPARLSVLTLDSLLLRMASSIELDGTHAPGWRIVEEETDRAMRGQACETALDLAEGEDLSTLFVLLHRSAFGRSVHQAMLRAVGGAREASRRAGEGTAWFGEGATAPTADELSIAIAALRSAPVPLTSKGAPDGRFTKAVATIADKLGAGDFADLGANALLGGAISGDRRYYKKTYDDALGDALEGIGDLVGRALLAELGGRNSATRELTGLFSDRYEAVQVARGARRFDDVPRMLLEQDLQGVLDHLYFRLDTSYRHVLLDEFQDTSLDQFALVRPLLEELVQDPDGEDGAVPRSVFVVGDPKQSLYTWRGAEPSLLGALPDLVPGVESESMETSWRSAQPILDTVNRVFEGLIDAPSFEGSPALADWLKGFSRHHAAPREPGIGGAVTLLETGERAKAARDRVRLVDELAAARVESILREAPGASVGVLVRKNARVRTVAATIRGHVPGLAVSEEGGGTLADSPVAGAVASMLRFCDHPGDTMRLFHFARTPLGPALDVGDPTDRVSAWRALLPFIEACGRHGFAASLSSVLSRCGDGMDAEGVRRAEAVVRVAEAFDAEQPGGRASSLAGWIETRAPNDPSGAGVRVMTVHQSKGLEFDAVVMPDLDNRWEVRDGVVLRPGDDGQAPTVSTRPGEAVRVFDRASSELHSYAEQREWLAELSVLYVGMTRARRRLDMIMEAPPDTPSDAVSAARALRETLAGEPDEGASTDSASRVLWAHALGSWAGDLRERIMDTSRPEAIPMRFDTSARRPVTRAPMVTPSRHAATVADRAAAPSDGAAHGLALHAALELLRWADDGLPADEAMIGQVVEAGVSGGEAPAVVAALRAQLSPFVPRLSRSWYADRVPNDGVVEVETEWDFATLGAAGELVSGRFDRLVIGRDPKGRAVWAEVLDYKSDTMREGMDRAEFARDRLRAHAAQLTTYRDAAVRMLGCNDVGAGLVLLSAGTWVELGQTDQVSE
ncbi:MAG: UvrD-helicase domain-containing protein [Planctomycetota bacterium]